MLATLAQLEAELITLVKSVPEFAASGWSVFDSADFAAKTAGQNLPTVAVAYDGAEQVGNEAIPVANRAHGAALVAVQFVIVIAAQYQYTGQDDSKQSAYALLDQVRAVVLGFKGVNTRPWRFVGERPEVGASGDGVIFYAQVWQTTLPIVGNFNNV
jgi:hypothetical protein